MIKGVNLAFIYVADMEAARKFWEETFGLPEPAIATPKWTEYSFDDNKGHFALHRGDDDKLTQTNQPGRIVFCFEVDDIQERVKKLEEAGVEFVMPLEDQKWYYLAAFKDSDGNILRLQQYKQN
jgi:predicted enzyme related to lactoylglutathione lyase